MSEERLKIRYVAAIGSIREVKRDKDYFRRHIPENYDWMTPEPPKIYRCCLFTPITETRPKRNAILRTLRQQRERGELEFAMCDSGGFQAGRYGLDSEQLVEEDYRIYTENDWADAYVMPDMPPIGGDPLPVMEEKTSKTMQMTRSLFDRLPPHLQAKSMPVFHVRNIEHIEQQYEFYKDIIDVSKMSCFSIAAPTPASYNRFDAYNFELMEKVSEIVGPDVHIHCLGLSSPLSVFCMAWIGYSTYDTISPKKSAGYGLILFPTGWFHFTERRKSESITFEDVEELREDTGHRCPFCDDVNLLYKSVHHRRQHNFIIMDELNYVFKDMDLRHIDRYQCLDRQKLPLLNMLTEEQMTLF